MTGFTPQAASDYDSRIPNLVPGYRLVQDLAAAVLAAMLPEEASILVAGCGTGAELILLAEREPGWRFTAADPSEGMLFVARARAREHGFDDRVDWIATTMEAVPPAPHDAALALLVGHFIADDGAKLGFLRALAGNLRPGAPLLLGEFDVTGLHPAIYRHWLISMEHDEASVEAVLTRTEKSWHPVTAERKTELLREAGFDAPEPFAQALGFRAQLVRRSL
ncbi:class I SAM-dependent methyltransferase [Bosea vestrisii]|uniref:Class I SAM-dependent methyltransferase n=1 Tax=Bosea vestrisii TaxID=151416 RepID=A0ABW0H8G4_9HYPH